MSTLYRGALYGALRRRKICVLLPAAGRRTQHFHLIFTEPGAHHKEHPCMNLWHCIDTLPPVSVPTMHIFLSPLYCWNTASSVLRPIRPISNDNTIFPTVARTLDMRGTAARLTPHARRQNQGGHWMPDACVLKCREQQKIFTPQKRKRKYLSKLVT